MRRITPLVWLAIGGVLAILWLGKGTIPLAAWLAPIFLLHFARIAPPFASLLSIRDEERAQFRKAFGRLQDWFLENTRREAQAGARIVVWPEVNLLVFKEDETTFLERAKRLGAEEQIYLLIGMGAVHLGVPRPGEQGRARQSLR